MKRTEVDRSGGSALARVVLCLAVASGGGLPGQTPEEPPQEPVPDAEPADYSVDFTNGIPPRADHIDLYGLRIGGPEPGDRLTVLFLGSVQWDYRLNGQPMRLLADLLVVYADFEEIVEEAEEAEEAEPADSETSNAQSRGGREPPPDQADTGAASEAAAPQATAASAGEAADEAEGLLDEMTIGPWRFRKYTVYAEGRVRIEFTDGPSHLEADSFYYEHPSGLAVARNARLMSTAAHAQTVGTAISSKNPRPNTSPLVDPGNPLIRTPIVIRADLLRMYAFRYFNGEGVRISTSTLAVPSVALESESIDVYPVEMTAEDVARLKAMSLSELEVEGAKELARRKKERAAGGKERSGGDRRPSGESNAADRDAEGEPSRDGVIAGEHFIIDPESTWFSVLGQPLAPLPVARWDTRWSYFLPFHSIEYGSSSSFGPFVDGNWNLNYLLNLFPFRDTALMQELDRTAKMGFETAYFGKRGFGYGPNAIYGTSPGPWDAWRPELGMWTYYGESRYFRIHDEGDEDRTTRLPIPRRDRYWGSVLHRQSIPYLGILDIEYSDLSDSAFLGEYFEEIAKEEKEQESLFYLRRNFGDNLSVTGLYKYRTNDFADTIERIPEGKGFLFQQPVFGSGLYTDAQVSASNIRLRPGEPSLVGSRRYDRYDLFNQWSYPVSALEPYVVLRPFSWGRYTYYGEVDDPAEGSEDRLTFAAGVSASQQWTRVFDFDSESFATRTLGISQLKHLIVPQVTYLNVFSNDLDSEDVIPTDEIDAVDLEESIRLSLRNDFITRFRRPGRALRRPAVLSDRNVELESVQYQSRRVFESNLALVLYPQAHRDNGGDRSSVIRFDNTAYLNRLALRGWFEMDPNAGFKLDRMDLSARVTAVPDRLVFTVGDRFTRNRTSTFYTDVRLWATPRWSFDGYWSHDFEDGRDVEWRVGVTRVFDRFALSLEFVEDVGEDRNKTFLVSVAPVELFRERLFRR